jgi:hypothetical protein
MADHDAQLERIAPTWLQTKDEQYLEYSARTGISRQRWDEYRRLFDRDDIEGGIQRDPDTGDAFIIVQSSGIVNRGYSNGFLHCGPGPNHRWPPCTLRRSEGSHAAASYDDTFYDFRRITDRWYAFSEGA